MTDALDVAGRPCLHQVRNWYNLVAALAAGGVPFCVVTACSGRRFLAW
jgi:hypothetical protein